MGNMIHIAADSRFLSDTEEDGGSVFVIPRSIYFTPAQMAAMIDAGQQPGVPFRIAGEGAQRPSRPMHRSRIVKNVAALHKNSFSMEIDENGRFAVRFLYDAVEEVSLYIYFGARDASSNKDISPKSSHLQWGPYSLDPGVNQEWSSARQQLHGDPKCLVCGGGGQFDAVVVLDHSATSSSPRGQKKYRLLSGGGDGGESTEGHVEGLTRKRRERGASVCVMRHASYFVIKPTPQSFARVPLQSASYGNSMGWAANVPVSNSGHHHRSKRRDRKRGGGCPDAPPSDGECSVAAIALKSNFQGPLALSCAMQKIQMQDGVVFMVQNVFGMDRGPTEEGGGGEVVDTDAAECVICLTEEKEVVVYPCRHMCMCMSCAEALPSQNNNCPICRRPVTLLLRLRAYGKGAGGQQWVAGDASGNGLTVAQDGKGIELRGSRAQNGYWL